MWRMRWFGTGWEHPELLMGNHVPTPVGRRCGRCGELIQEDDQGIIISAGYSGESEVEAHAWPGPVHKRCSGLDMVES